MIYGFTQLLVGQAWYCHDNAILGVGRRSFFADDGVFVFSGGLVVELSRLRLAGGAVVGVVTGCSVW